ncbi:DinB family protein [Pontibacter arcticus]|uniref:DinB-like domain-containing protein n=1 Tax=Pontibacter arcticus TaxID=2080288 RepID=A0A364RJB8_9BACT|nr:DinB family protein [Pontibacter arcticus]RAU84420.1 hypothetical protein DP923_05135 [Pontibacter arcticus]
MTFDKIFFDSFDTFKVLQNMDVSKASLQYVNTPKSIWQILNHLIVWQESQLNKLKGLDSTDIEELDTWKTDPVVRDQGLLQQIINTFNNQIEQIKNEIQSLSIESKDIENKLKIVQDLSVHLSFHLGEMILQLRQNGHYPMPSEMTEFLAS